ncbi:calcium:proton antiporter [Fastidiosibacter lacustris]|uniref:calcium:proton antiporter n=1 Tax=Fastidiosibacter lacustris TaxID=2056695 RepID=UPI000E34972B|nr:calcium:proton antiporter [Fastidiosibacter lacustris]
MQKISAFIKAEYGVVLPIILFILINFIFTTFNPQNISHFVTAVTTFTIFCVMLICAFNVVKHADRLAHKFGEPYGTIILTLSVISIEVALIITMMLIGKGDSTLARDTMFAVIMIAVNGFAGLSLLTGGIKHNTQMYNIEGASIYISLLILLLSICLILPNYTVATDAGTFNLSQSIIVIVVCVILYANFLVMQTITHSDYFQFSLDHKSQQGEQHSSMRSVCYHVTLLLIGLIVMIALSKNLGTFLEYSIQEAGLPSKLGGFIIALLVLTPEGVSAIQAAYKNQLQRSINLCMGSAVATICLTVPSVIVINLILGHPLILGLNSTSIVILMLTFFISLITFTSRRTSVFNGVVLLTVFAIYFALIFDTAQPFA